MAKFDVAENVSVEEFFKEAVPKQFGDMISGADMSALSGKEFKLQFDVEGKKYCPRLCSKKSKNELGITLSR